MPMKKIMLALPEEMVDALEKERKERYLETLPETVRVIVSDYLRNKLRKRTT
jgi:metal-responsive CopG/Arc/MetJ family transcriptional regulator